jgi:hypothetical protein
MYISANNALNLVCTIYLCFCVSVSRIFGMESVCNPTTPITLSLQYKILECCLLMVKHCSLLGQYRTVYQVIICVQKKKSLHQQQIKDVRVFSCVAYRHRQTPRRKYLNQCSGAMNQHFELRCLLLLLLLLPVVQLVFAGSIVGGYHYAKDS